MLSFVALFFVLGCASPNLVSNGAFENLATVGQAGVQATISSWTVSPAQNSAQPHAFVFIVDSNADSTGFPSENPPPNIKLWGPGGGVNNGFTGSPNGGVFLGASADYAYGTISQTISGLSVGAQYDLTFDWAGSQFTDQTGATDQWFQVDFGSDSVDTTHSSIPSKGFSGWQSYSHTFTATSASQVLKFTPKATPFTNGDPATLYPFLLLDGVSLVASAPPPPTPTVTSLAPSTGSTAGGFDVVITGTDFPATPSVLFGSVAATVKASPAPTSTSITVTAPPCGAACTGQATTIVDVTVTDSTGKRFIALRAPNSFTYVAAVATE